MTSIQEIHSAPRLGGLRAYIFWIILIGMLSACNPDYSLQSRPILHTTISADGEIVATLLNAGTDEQLLRVRNLKPDSNWRTVTAPPFTQSIRFGLQGHELLLTHQISLQPKKDVLSKLNLDQSRTELKHIYEAEDLAFPLEVKPGQVMVRTGHPVAKGSHVSNYNLILIGPGEQVKSTEPVSAPPYGNINIVGSGYFWTEDQISKTGDAHPRLRRFPLPGGHAPNISDGLFEKNTTNISCDRFGHRCLRSHIENLDGTPGTSFLYNVDVLFGAEKCKLFGVSGYHDGVSVTPDGNAAVMALAPAYNRPRLIVVIRFNPKQCEASSVQFIDFKEK